MQPPKPVPLSTSNLCLRRDGGIDFVPRDFPGVITWAKGNALWDPGLDGLFAGVGEQSVSSDHEGERHLDGEELLYVFSGSFRLWLEYESGETTEVLVRAGEAIAVPKGVWHRLLIDAPCRYLFCGGGRTEIRNPKSPT
jgi:uncharacterized RmlC-like cupin family protein